MCTEKKVSSIEAHARIWHFFDFHISTTNNKKKKVDSRASEISLFLQVTFLSDIEMSLSKVDPFPFVYVSMKVSVFPCPSVTDFPLFCSTVLTERKGLKFFRNEQLKLTPFLVQTNNNKDQNKASYKLLCNCLGFFCFFLTLCLLSGGPLNPKQFLF